jgi:MFS family permease
MSRDPLPEFDAVEPSVPLRTQAAIYATGGFGNASENVYSVILPLWAVTLGASPLMVGMLIGARHFLAALLAIPGGALMDRLGTRRVLLAVGLIGAVTPLMYPSMPWLAAALMLQLIGGLSSAFSWMGAQAQVGEIMRGSPAYAGRMSFSLRITQVAGPPLAGLSWDIGGPWGGFAFLALWGICQFIAILALPRPAAPAPTGDAVPAKKLRLGDIMPRLSDYGAALGLLAVSAIALVMMLTILRISGNGIHFSFYVVYLKDVGFTGTSIGLLVAAASLFGFAGALSIAPMSRRFSAHWLLLVLVAAGIALVSITPLLGASFIALALAASMRGWLMGLSQPVMISMLARAAGPGNQGKAVGLRTTANRIASSTVPVLMGAVVEVVGLHNGFYVFGGVLLLALLPVARYVARTPAFAARKDAP